VLAASVEDQDKETLLRLSSMFGGGIAHTGGTCGAVTGALMAIGLRLGTSEPKIPPEKARRTAAEFIKRFYALHGSVDCNAMRGVAGPSGVYVKGENELCTGFVRDAADMLQELL